MSSFLSLELIFALVFMTSSHVLGYTEPLSDSQDSFIYEKLVNQTLRRNSYTSISDGLCQLHPIIHHIKYEGCQHKLVDSFACVGTCPSYSQISSNNYMELEKSCTCCQQTRYQEKTIILDCPSLDPAFKKVNALIPTGCMCKICRSFDFESVKPQELLDSFYHNIS